MPGVLVRGQMGSLYGLGGASLYSKVQCIMGNGHMGPPMGIMTERQTISLAGGKIRIFYE